MSLSSSDLRFEVRRHLASRPPASFSLEEIVHGLARKTIEVSKEHVLDALVYLSGLNPPQVKTPASSVNAVRYQITSAGVVAHENNE